MEEKEKLPASLEYISSQLETFSINEKSTRADVSALQAGFGALSAKVDTLIDAVKGIAHKTDQPTNWIGIGSLMVALGIAMSGYIQTRLTPTEATVGAMQEMTPMMFKQNGEILRGLQAHDKWLTRNDGEQIESRKENSQTKEKLAKLEGKFEMLLHSYRDHVNSGGHPEILSESKAANARITLLEQIVRDIDSSGSRRWNKDKDKTPEKKP